MTNPKLGVPPAGAKWTTLFAHSPSDALQCLLDLKEGMRRARQLEYGTDPVVSLLTSDADWMDWQNFVNHAEPFYWSAQTASLVTAASKSYPLNAESAVNLSDVAAKLRAGDHLPPPSYLPKRPRGFCVFEEPCLFIAIQGRVEPLSALGWMVGVGAKNNEIRLSLRGVLWTPRAALVIWWSDGGSAEDVDDDVDGTFRAERLALTKWICTAAMFVEQEIMVASPANVSRAVSKRCEKVQLPTNCHVVTLRKELANDRQGSGLGNVEWSHQWLVRGHWRRQFFPSRGGHAPIWIHPHVKGPSDKPFMEPKPTVYAVTR